MKSGKHAKRLGDVMQLQRGYDLPTLTRTEGDVPVVSSGGVSGTHSESKAKAPGVVTGRYGSIGDVHFLEKDYWPLNTTLYVKDFKGNDPRYAYHLLQSLNFDPFKDKTGVPGVNRNDLHRITVWCPDIDEQRRIVAVLSAWDRGIEAAERLLALKQQRKRALMQQLLTGKRRFPEFSEPWRQAPLSQIVEPIYRTGPANAVLSISSKKGFERQEKKYSKVMAGKNLENYILLRQGEFAYNKGNSLTYPQGCVFRLDDYNEAAVPNVYFCFHIKDPNENDSCFMRYVFEAGLLNRGLRGVINTGVRNNGLLNLYERDFYAVKVGYPKIEEQQRIAAVLRTCDEEIDHLITQLEALKLQKRGLMQKLLTGQVRVPQEAK